MLEGSLFLLASFFLVGLEMYDKPLDSLLTSRVWFILRNYAQIIIRIFLFGRLQQQPVSKPYSALVNHLGGYTCRSTIWSTRPDHFSTYVVLNSQYQLVDLLQPNYYCTTDPPIDTEKLSQTLKQSGLRSNI